ncbi:hypothetical protein ASF10_08910 [Flavobacterium sp. Leaf82]|jgi:hypothetical protein|uniref:hypothetical protein n=1 Tax=unclassified Flavobacterium TaxID=196869 RepID=UPI0006FE6C60|nr:hypothetical protein [Flavobacterium sp. Leaf82]KQO22486.1 hypothetical protein ASF10_08910 [Flavobacterium sp. Leaf82]
MITYNNFTEVVQTISKSYNNKKLIVDDIIENPRSINLIENIQNQIFKTPFIINEIVSEGVKFSLKDNPAIFFIKKEDFNNEDPPLYVNEKGKLTIYFNTSSVIILTELASYVYKNSLYKKEHDGFGIYSALRENFKLICKDSEYFCKIWAHKEFDCFALTDGKIEKIYFVSNSNKNISKLSPMIPPTIEKEKKTLFISNLLIDSYIQGRSLHAKAKLQGNNNLIEVLLEVENKQLNFSNEINFFKKIINNFSIQKQDHILNQVAQEITDAAYNQTNNVVTNQEDLTSLKKDLAISKLVIIEDDLLLHLKSNQILPNSDIVVQMNEELLIVDLSISPL